MTESCTLSIDTNTATQGYKPGLPGSALPIELTQMVWSNMEPDTYPVSIGEGESRKIANVISNRAYYVARTRHKSMSDLKQGVWHCTMLVYLVQ